MEELKKIIEDKYGSSKYKLEQDYRNSYEQDMTFRKIANDLDIPKETLMKYTSKLEESANELKICKKCKNIMECKNLVNGYVYYPINNGGNIEFCYMPCKYKKELDQNNEYKKNISYFNISKDIKDARMDLIDTKDKNRMPVIKYLVEFIKDYKKGIKNKGLYLNGNFGCGKTYLVSATLNELAKNGIKVGIIYYPEFLRSLKENFGYDNEYKLLFNEAKKVEVLLLDDLGAETVTEWSRDEVLGTILQYRMEEHLTTFFTSNLTLEELEEHLSTTSKEVDKVKSRRIMERIKQLSLDMTMISENKRK